MLAWRPVLVLGLLGVLPGLLWAFSEGQARFSLTFSAVVLIGIPISAYFLGRRVRNAFVHVLAAHTVAGGVFALTMVLGRDPSMTSGATLAQLVGQSLLAIVFTFVLGLVYGLVAVRIKRMRMQPTLRPGARAP